MNPFNERRNFLIATWEGGGSVGPKLTVARKLVDAGHRVRIMSDACNRPEAEATGASFVPWTRAPSRKDRNRESELILDWAQANPVDGFKQAIDAVFAGQALAYAQDTIEELDREPADLVIASDFLLGVLAACEARGQRHVAMPCNILLMPLVGAPRAFPAHRDDLSESERAEIAAMGEVVKQMFDHGLPPLNAARAELGLPAIATLAEQFEAAARILIGVSKTFDFGDDSNSPRFAYIGPQIDDVAWADEWISPWQDEAAPRVLVSFSTTFQNHVAVLQRVVDALGQLPVQAIVTLGPTVAPEEVSAAANVHLLKSAPHNVAMREADLVVSHGGHGTVARAMTNRLPQLVIPHGRDQDGNAARIAAHGAGLTLPPSSSTDDIRAALERLLDDTSFTAKARVLGDAVAAEMENSRVVEEIEALCCPVLA